MTEDAWLPTRAAGVLAGVFAPIPRSILSLMVAASADPLSSSRAAGPRVLPSLVRRFGLGRFIAMLVWSDGVAAGTGVVGRLPVSKGF